VPPAVPPGEPGIRSARFDRADRRVGQAVRSLRRHQPREHSGPDPGLDWPDRDIGADPGPHFGPDPAPHYRAGESVHFAHRVAVQPGPSRPAGQPLVSVARPAVQTQPRPEPTQGSCPALRKLSISSNSLLNPSRPGETPDPSSWTYCIDGNSRRPSLVLTQFYGKSYAYRPSLPIFVAPGNDPSGVVDKLDIHRPFADYSRVLQLGFVPSTASLLEQWATTFTRQCVITRPTRRARRGTRFIRSGPRTNCELPSLQRPPLPW
jgi:hypothetical protein